MNALQQRLKYTFKSPELLETALTHSSWINEAANAGTRTGQHNERLEFLGDAVLELAVSAGLFARYKDAREGELTRIRATLVNTHALAELARELGLKALIRMGRGEESQGGRERDALLADAMEAVLGAVYEDGGFTSASDLVCRLYATRWPEKIVTRRDKDNKTRLQELTQNLARMGHALPKYVPDGFIGPEHARLFAAIVELPDGQRFRATGQSRRAAEQEAARLALEANA